jgi:hypothetical protein
MAPNYHSLFGLGQVAKRGPGSKRPDSRPDLTWRCSVHSGIMVRVVPSHLSTRAFAVGLGRSSGQRQLVSGVTGETLIPRVQTVLHLPRDADDPASSVA